MPVGLSVSDVVNVSINLQPIATPARNFGALCVIGDADVIDVGSRLRQYTSLDGVAGDFGTTAPEYLAANLFFSQNPQPAVLYVGRWASGTTAGELLGGFIGTTEQATLLTTLQAIANGGFSISVDGTPHTLTGLNFTGISNLNGAATVLDTAMTAYADVVWNATIGSFIVTSHTSGPSSSVTVATNPGSGAPLATDFHFTTATGARAVAGADAETPVEAVQALAPLNADVYGLMFAAAATITDDDYLAVAAYVEGATPTHILGITTQEPAAVDGASSSDLGARLSAARYARTFWQFSSSSAYAVASMFGRAFTTDFNANNSMITLKFKQEPGVTAESLSETQAAVLDAKHGNVFVNYMNNTAIIQQGVMADGAFFDERQGSDWLQFAVQSDLYNLLYTSPTKVPQTDSGVHQLLATVEATMDRAVHNGFVAPGVWTSGFEFGLLKQGMALTRGYYCYAAPLVTQAQSDREARKAPVIQVAVKLAGAVHSAAVVINVNR